jgi:hypothetical protein
VVCVFVCVWWVCLRVAPFLSFLCCCVLRWQVNGSAVTSWMDESTAGFAVTQSNALLQPVYVSDAFGQGAGGVSFDGVKTFLANSKSSIPTGDSTMFIVLKVRWKAHFKSFALTTLILLTLIIICVYFQDDGSTGNGCCSGALFFTGGFQGISTVTGNADFSDDAPSGGAPVTAMLDYAGSNVGWCDQRLVANLPMSSWLMLSYFSCKAMKTFAAYPLLSRVCMGSATAPYVSMAAK